MPIVYKATSRLTGKVYIGCTTKGLELRKSEHAASAANGSTLKFHVAIRNDGMGTFDWGIVGNYNSTTEMYSAERMYVERYNSFRNGYNSSPGGKGSKADGMRMRMRGYVAPPRRRY